MADDVAVKAPAAAGMQSPLQRERARTIFEKGAPGRRAFTAPALGFDQVACRISTRQPVRRRENSAMMRGVASLAALAMKPTRRKRAARLAALLVSRSTWSQSASSAGTRSARVQPGSVRVMPVRDRVNSRTPSWVSSCLICLVSAGWDTNSRSAARLRVPSSATAMK